MPIYMNFITISCDNFLKHYLFYPHLLSSTRWCYTSLIWSRMKDINNLAYLIIAVMERCRSIHLVWHVSVKTMIAFVGRHLMIQSCRISFVLSKIFALHWTPHTEACDCQVCSFNISISRPHPQSAELMYRLCAAPFTAGKY